MTNEGKLIERIRRALPSRDTPGPDRLRLGIGDDAAVLRLAARTNCVLSCDMFLENVHFLAEEHPPEVVGYKALARATSDLAAMGARPRYFLLSLALPSLRATKWLDGMLRGMSRAARRFGLVLAGGDTARQATVCISITVLGEVDEGSAVTRAGARAGDLIFVSGRLGGAQLGLELILRGMQREKRWRGLLRAQYYPPVRTELGEWLARPRRGEGQGLARGSPGHGIVSAMMDLSDGLSTDLARLCAASAVGARVYAEGVPAVSVSAELAHRGIDAEELALHGGEDYELLFTVPRRKARVVPQSRDGVPLTCIGEITAAKEIVLVDECGRGRPLAAKGWDHFRQQQGVR